MSDEVMVLEEKVGLRLVATDPAQLQQSQKQLIAWCDRKIRAVREEAREFRQNLDVAKASKWNTARPKAYLRLAEGRLTFYRKIKDALEAGFYIVPNFPIDLFAIRTTAKEPSGRTERYQSKWNWRVTPERSMLLESGDGDNVNPEPVTSRRASQVTGANGSTQTVYDLTPTTFVDVDFPFVLAKPQVLEETQRAMALKIFDEIGTCPQTKKSDPMVIGIIKAPRRGYMQKQVSFLIAWFLDTDTL